LSAAFLYSVVFPALALGLPVLLLPRRPRPGLWLVAGLYGMYTVWVPCTDRLWGITHFFGKEVPAGADMDWLVGTVYGIGFSAYGLAYWLSERFWPGREVFFQSPDLGTRQNGIKLGVLQGLIWVLVIWNLLETGVSLRGLFDLGNRNPGNILFSAAWAHPWVDLLSNALPVCLFLDFYRKEKPGYYWWILFLIWFGFALLGGWRYRIVLMVLFFGIYNLRKFNKVRPIHLAAGGMLIVLMALLTLNRMALAKRQFDVLTLDVRQFDLPALNMEFSNHRTFRCTLEWMKNRQEKPPGVISWWNFVEQRLVQKSKFQDGQRPRPWILETTKAWIPPGWPWNPNPAVTQIEEGFLSFGWYGMCIWMALFGIWVAFLDQLSRGKLGMLFQAICVALLFQWISRGFFLFQIQITLVCLIPVLVLALPGPYLPYDSKQHKA
jgi:hypothetical protein